MRRWGRQETGVQESEYRIQDTEFRIQKTEDRSLLATGTGTDH
jgi:hypothetical protein